jgi:hypothetical protein
MDEKHSNRRIKYDPDSKPGELAQTLMAASRVVDLRSDADELADLVREIQRPLPELTSVSMLQLYRLLRRERDRSRRLLALVARGM